MKVSFQGQIKQLLSRIMGTGDKGGKLVIEFNIYDDKLIGDLANLVKADEEIEITISDD